MFFNDNIDTLYHPYNLRGADKALESRRLAIMAGRLHLILEAYKGCNDAVKAKIKEDKEDEFIEKVQEEVVSALTHQLDLD